MARHKTGRRAGEDDRRIAAEWVALYKQAQQSPDGYVCVNPEDKPDLHTNLYADDVDLLLSILQDFAGNGTFQNVDSHGFDAMLLNMEYKRLRKSGVGYTDAIAELAENKNCATRTIERRLPTNRDTD